MDGKLRSLFAFLFLALLAVAVTPAQASSDCGTTVAQVIAISKAKYPQVNHARINNFIGNWLNDGEVYPVTLNDPLILKGYAIKVCPLGTNGFVVRWVSNGAVAGQLYMRGRNQLVVANTMAGTILFDREDAVAARN